MSEFIEKNKSWVQLVLFLGTQAAFMIGSWQAIIGGMNEEIVELKNEFRTELRYIRDEIKEVSGAKQMAETNRADLREHKSKDGHDELSRDFGRIEGRVESIERALNMTVH